MSNLVIVESPTKARTLSKFLGSKYRIEASMGHIRDLPKSNLGVEVENNFKPEYIIPRDKRKRVNELKKLAKDAKIIYLATDPDREGEAIAWHLAHITKDPKSKSILKRVVFHEITENAIKEAFDHPRDIDMKLVDAQQARRILDRLVGYKLSPILWQKVKRGLSAGRVQTVALKLIVEREREIEAFKAIEYWSIDAELKAAVGESFLASLIELNSKKLEVNNETDAKKHAQNLENASYEVSKIAKKEVRKYPPPPFTTSTLQQSSGNKLGLTAKRTMMIAQNLYEHGLITYMRTDSVNLSAQAVDMAREFITSNFGKNFLPPTPRVYKSKSKNAQEAHEAIRPTNLKTIPERIQGEGFTRDHKRVYELIWKRMLSSQISEAVYDQTTVDVTAKSTHSGMGIDNYLLRTTGSVVKFEGWLKLYGIEVLEEEDAPKEGEESQPGKKQNLPKLSELEKLTLLKILPEQHFTQPPPKFTEASLIKKLEELGIGRPSTYAPILSTIQERLYVERLERKFTPTVLGTTTVDFLVKYFPETFEYQFTADMEDKLDEVSRGERKWQETIAQFYKPLEEKLEKTQHTAERVKMELEVTEKICPKCGKNLVVRTGKFGKFLACIGFPECKHTESQEQVSDVQCPTDGGELVIRRTRKGKSFYGCKNWPECKFASWTKPKPSQSNQPT